MVEANRQDNYLVLKKVELKKTELNEQSVDEIMNVYLEKLITVDASFLPETNWNLYEEIFLKLKILESKNIITDAQKITEGFKGQKKLIENSEKFFSHNDYNLSNLKRLGGKLIVSDFEYARRDNAMVDMATFYIDLCDNNELQKYFREKLNKHPLYNEELFDLMVLRRCILVMNSLADNQESSYFRKNLLAFNSISEKIC